MDLDKRPAQSRAEDAGLATVMWLTSIVVVACVLATGCFVEGHCRNDEDCESPLICTSDRLCKLECNHDSECPLAEICRSHRCVAAPGCVGCRFPNADATCVHGLCSMGECRSGWVDANESPDDGCELFCTPTGDELCDGLDNDCDALIDEDFDLSTDPDHCGACDRRCPRAANASPVCASGECGSVCQDGWYDNNTLLEDGCEDPFCISIEEICDLNDNDCDDLIDEGFDKTSPDSCGLLCTVCEYDNAEAHCLEGECAMGTCLTGWWDIDGWTANGCEYPCTPSGDEVCDGEDNNCDGHVDEGLLCCADDQVAIDGLFCIDIYEASLEEGEGGDLQAVSRSGVDPFWDRDLTVEEAQAYCEAAGKRLCNAAEWVHVCQGPDQLTYCYGDTYEPTTCNGIDAFGPGNFELAPTESFPDCTNSYGIFDINGNVWEMTEDGLVRGGAFNCIDSATLHECDYSIEPERVVAIGFRCCR